MPLARTVTLAAQAQLDLKASPVLLVTTALLAKMESVTLVDPDLKEKLAHLATQVKFYQSYILWKPEKHNIFSQ